jgi:hypothetical protein
MESSKLEKIACVVYLSDFSNHEVSKNTKYFEFKA